MVRVGFNGSGISRFNRILERHDSAQGMYWRTYDFDEPPANLTERGNGNLLPDRRNIFAFPLGPSGLAEFPFKHAGGEAIFALPNGLSDASGAELLQLPAMREGLDRDALVEALERGGFVAAGEEADELRAAAGADHARLRTMLERRLTEDIVDPGALQRQDLHQSAADRKRLPARERAEDLHHRHVVGDRTPKVRLRKRAPDLREVVDRR